MDDMSWHCEVRKGALEYPHIWSQRLNRHYLHVRLPIADHHLFLAMAARTAKRSNLVLHECMILLLVLPELEIRPPLSI